MVIINAYELLKKTILVEGDELIVEYTSKFDGIDGKLLCRIELPMLESLDYETYEDHDEHGYYEAVKEFYFEDFEQFEKLKKELEIYIKEELYACAEKHKVPRHLLSEFI